MATAPDTTAPFRDQDDWLALLPPQLVCLSPMQIRLLLRVTLSQPLFDLAATLALINYQQRHKRAAYRSHRARRLRQARQSLQPAPHLRTGRLTAALARPRDNRISL